LKDKLLLLETVSRDELEEEEEEAEDSERIFKRVVGAEGETTGRGEGRKKEAPETSALTESLERQRSKETSSRLASEGEE
jgi:hypothetical protein